MAEGILKNVRKGYDKEIVAVDDADIEIKDKEFVVLVGPSGCGKSTTLRMIAGWEEITGGDIFIDGTLVNDIPPKDRDIAMVFQNYALYPHMTVYQNMAFGLKLRKYPKDEIDQRVREAADILLLTHHITRDKKYLKPFDRYFTWLDSIRTPTGWYQWYDHKTGRPLAATKGSIYWLDKPDGVKAFLKATSSRSNYTPDVMKPADYDRLKRYREDAKRGEFGFWHTRRLTNPRQVVPLLKTWLEHPKMATTFTWTDKHGMKLSDTVAGPAFMASDHGPTKYTLRVSLLTRAALGEIGLGQISPLNIGVFERTHVIAEPCEFFDVPPLRKDE